MFLAGIAQSSAKLNLSQYLRLDVGVNRLAKSLQGNVADDLRERFWMHHQSGEWHRSGCLVEPRLARFYGAVCNRREVIG